MSHDHNVSHHFTYKELFLFGWEKTKQHFWFLMGVGAISVVVSLIGGMIPVVSTVVSMLVSIACLHIVLMIAKGHSPTYKDLLKPFEDYKIAWHYFLASLLIMLAFVVVSAPVALIIISDIYSHNTIGLISLFIIALVIGLLVSYYAVRLQFFKYIIVNHKETSPIDAFQKSLDLTEGLFWELSGFLAIVVLLNIGGALLVGLGLLVTVPMSSLAYTHLYLKLSGHHTQSS